MENSMFKRFRVLRWDFFFYAESEWRVPMYIVISNKVHKQLRWYIYTVNIVFTFEYAVFYNCNHHLCLLKARNFFTSVAAIFV